MQWVEGRVQGRGGQAVEGGEEERVPSARNVPSEGGRAPVSPGARGECWEPGRERGEREEREVRETPGDPARGRQGGGVASWLRSPLGGEGVTPADEVAGGVGGGGGLWPPGLKNTLPSSRTPDPPQGGGGGMEWLARLGGSPSLLPLRGEGAGGDAERGGGRGGGGGGAGGGRDLSRGEGVSCLGKGQALPETQGWSRLETGCPPTLPLTHTHAHTLPHTHTHTHVALEGAGEAAGRGGGGGGVTSHQPPPASDQRLISTLEGADETLQGRAGGRGEVTLEGAGEAAGRGGGGVRFDGGREGGMEWLQSPLAGEGGGESGEAAEKGGGG